MTNTTTSTPIYDQVTKDLGFSLESVREGSVLTAIRPAAIKPRTKRERHKLNRAQAAIMRQATQENPVVAPAERVTVE